MTIVSQACTHTYLMMYTAGMKTMANYNTPASVMPSLMAEHCKVWSQADTEDVRFGDPKLFGRLRYAVPFLCLVQIGYLLTKHCHKDFTQAQDGTPVDTPRGRHHVETFVISSKDLQVRALPWVQSDKKGTLVNRVGVY